MPDSQLPDNAPATALFPQFESAIYRMIAAEVEGLTDLQLDFESDNWEWSKWSIRRNLSHMASGDFRWFLLRWGQQLFPEGLPDLGADDLESLAASPHDRRLDEDKYWGLDSILEKLRQGLEVAQTILSGETVGSLRIKETREAGPSPGRWFAEAHPTGVRWESHDSSRSYLTLEATFRHRYFEHITHLYNIQRLKRAQGLPTRVEVPFEGYWALPDWDRSEP